MAMLYEIGPTFAPVRGWRSSAMSTAPARTAPIVQPWNVEPAAGNGATGSSPLGQVR